MPSMLGLPLLLNPRKLLLQLDGPLPGKDISALKGVGDRLYMVALVRKVYRSYNTPQGFGCGEEQPVVRSYQVGPAVHLSGERSPLDFGPGVNDGRVHSIRSMYRVACRRISAPRMTSNSGALCVMSTRWA